MRISFEFWDFGFVSTHDCGGVVFLLEESIEVWLGLAGCCKNPGSRLVTKADCDGVPLRFSVQ
jgi:hypothetical protein